MKTNVCILIFCLATTALLFAADTNMVSATGTNILSSEAARVSYAIGMMLGQTWQQQGVDVNPEIAARAIKDVQSGGKTLLTAQEMRDTLSAFQRDFMAKQEQRRMEIAAKAQADGVAFLATNKNNPGVITLPDGLQYLVITNGTGPVPGPTDRVTVNYRGMFIDGKEFDGTATGHPAQFSVNGVIPGWTEALTRMKVGSKWRLFVPSELAYGVRGRHNIPSNSALIFEIELLATQSAPPPPPPPSNNQPVTSDIIKVPSAEEVKKGAKIEILKPEDVEKMQKQKPQ